MGSSGSRSNVYKASDYYSDDLNALQKSLYNAIAPTADESKQTPEWNNSAFGKAWQNSQKQSAVANNLFDSAASRAPGLQNQFDSAMGNYNGMANKINALGDGVNYNTAGLQNMTNKIAGLGDRAAALEPSVSDQMGKNNSAIGNLANKIEGVGDRQGDLATTIKGFTEGGKLPAGMLAEMNKAVNSELNRNTGSALNDLAARGVMNSSVANRSIANLENAAADAYSKNYLDAYNAVLNGYGQTNNTLASQGDTYSKAISGYNNANANIKDMTAQQLAILGAAGDQYKNALGGEQAILGAQQQQNADKLAAYNAALNGYSGVANGYSNAITQNNAALNQYANLPAEVAKGLSAQFSPAYNFWKDWTKNVNDGTVVSESSGGK